MSWVRVDDKAWSHPKFANLPAGAVRLWLFAMCWCNQQETDGHVPRPALKLLGSSLRHASDLVATGLWHETSTGWVIHDFLEYQASKSDREHKREALKQRVSRHRNAKVTEDVTRYNGVGNAVGNSTRRNAAPTPRPIPHPRPHPTHTAREAEPTIGETLVGATRDELVEAPPASCTRASQPPPAAPTDVEDVVSHYAEVVMGPTWEPPPGTLMGTGAEAFEAEALGEFRAYHTGNLRTQGAWLKAYRLWVVKLKNDRAGRASRVVAARANETNNAWDEQVERVAMLREQEAADAAREAANQ